MARLLVVISALGLVVGCASKSEVDALKAEVQTLQAKVEELANKPAPVANAAPDAAAENAARELLQAAQVAQKQGDISSAKSKLAELTKKFGSTRTAARAVRLKEELDVVGKATKPLTNPEWITGTDAGFDLSSDAGLVVFFEQWCPHCKREVPKLQATFEKYKGRMGVVGLTKMSRSSTLENTKELLTSNNVTYPVAKEGGGESQYYAVSGIPAAIFVNGGKVLWRGHPGTLSDDMIEKFINN